MSEFTVIVNKSRNRESVSAFMSETWTKSYGVFRINEDSVSISQETFSMTADLTSRHNGTIYIENNADPEKRSAVISFGWCYRIGNKINQFDQNDAALFLESHRLNKVPDLTAFSGLYCVLSYDHVSNSLWICTDLWAQHGFYYGANTNVVVISSKASIVADSLRAGIDGISYLALLRESGIPPGRTLYNDVWRITCGRAITVDNNNVRLVRVHPLYSSEADMRFQEAVEQFIGVVSSVCPFAASRPSTIVDLTGGNDSRILASALAVAHGGAIGKQVVFKVVGNETHPDVLIAEQIASLFGWTLRRNDRGINIHYSAENMCKAAVLSDGQFLIKDVIRRITQESKWSSYDCHVGSIGGELFRDFFWRHELYNMGRSSKINYDALLRHRLYANDIDIERVSDNRLTNAKHDMYLIQPYKMIDSILPEISNAYKLDIFYLHKLMYKSLSWVLSDIRTIILPFLSSEITMLSLRIPWKFRLNRRLVTAAIEKISPPLSLINNDKGAPMRPLRLSTLNDYLNFTITDFKSAYNRHFRKQKQSEELSLCKVPAEWVEIVNQGKMSRELYDTIPLRKKLGKKDINNVSSTLYQEIQVLLLVELLTEKYKGIFPSLCFNSKDVNFIENELIL